MRIVLSSLALVALLLGAGMLAAPPAAAAGGMAAGGAEAPVGLLTGLLAVAFLIAHQAMSDD